MSDGMMLRISAPHFVAAVVLDTHGVVRRCAPIVKYMRDRPVEYVNTYCAAMRWDVEAIFPPASGLRPIGQDIAL